MKEVIPFRRENWFDPLVLYELMGAVGILKWLSKEAASSEGMLKPATESEWNYKCHYWLQLEHQLYQMFKTELNYQMIQDL